MCHFWSSVSALGWRGLSGGGRAPYIHTHTRRDTAHPTENVLRCWSAWALLGAARIGLYFYLNVLASVLVCFVFPCAPVFVGIFL